MVTAWEYFIQNQEIVITRCFGTGDEVCVPEQIGGLPVRELADHAFAPEPTVRWPNQPRYRAAAGEGTGSSEEETPVCGEMVAYVSLPRTLRRIGDYAFYQCFQLKELSVYGGELHLGGGVFVGCHQVGLIRVQEAEQESFALKDILSELHHELDVRLDFADGSRMKLVYPEYYEESKENTPARIIEIKFEGTGYKYRQCFAGRKVDLRAYDRLFPLAVAQEYMSTRIRMAQYRLRYPRELGEEAAAAYLEFLRREYRENIKDILERRDFMLLEILDGRAYFTEELLKEFLDEAAVRREPEAVSILMEIRHRRFGHKKKEFTF